VFHRLRADFPDAALTVIGDGPDAERTRAAIGDQLGKSIHLVGALYDEEALASYFLSADVVLFSGAVGLSVNHALAYGVPVIAHDRTPSGPHHHPEIAYVVDGVTGLRVSPFAEDAMLRALQSFLSRYPDPKAAFRDSIRQYVDAHMTLDAMVEDFRKVREFLRHLGIGKDQNGPMNR
jgi:glycosyltransferase involved in cell wall biosynthesis